MRAKLTTPYTVIVNDERFNFAPGVTVERLYAPVPGQHVCRFRFPFHPQGFVDAAVYDDRFALVPCDGCGEHGIETATYIAATAQSAAVVDYCALCRHAAEGGDMGAGAGEVQDVLIPLHEWYSDAAMQRMTETLQDACDEAEARDDTNMEQAYREASQAVWGLTDDGRGEMGADVRDHTPVVRFAGHVWTMTDMAGGVMHYARREGDREYILTTAGEPYAPTVPGSLVEVGEYGQEHSEPLARTFYDWHPDPEPAHAACPTCGRPLDD